MLDEETDTLPEKVLVKTEVYLKNEFQGNGGDTIYVYHLQRASCNVQNHLSMIPLNISDIKGENYHKVKGFTVNESTPAIIIP